MGSRFRGSTAVVAGGGSAVGAATAEQLAARGCHVVLVGVHGQALSAVAAGIGERGGRADSLVADPLDPVAVQAVARTITGAHGVPSILVNCLTAGRPLGLLEASALESAQRLLDPYLTAFNLTRELLPRMLARGGGHIANVLALPAQPPGACDLHPARCALEALTSMIRAESGGSSLTATFAALSTAAAGAEEAQAPGRAAPLTADRAAVAVVRAIERRQRTVILPRPVPARAVPSARSTREPARERLAVPV